MVSHELQYFVNDKLSWHLCDKTYLLMTYNYWGSAWAVFERVSGRSAGRWDRKEDSRHREQRMQRPGGAEQQTKSRKSAGWNTGACGEQWGMGLTRETVDSVRAETLQPWAGCLVQGSFIFNSTSAPWILGRRSSFVLILSYPMYTVFVVCVKSFSRFEAPFSYNLQSISCPRPGQIPPSVNIRTSYPGMPERFQPTLAEGSL